MFVYLKEPMGYTQIDRYRIYGRNYCYGKFGPTDIPRKLYLKHRDVLEEIIYTPEILKKKHGVNFPPVNFKLSQLKYLDFEVVIEIARCLGLKYLGTKKPTMVEKRILTKAICRDI